MSIYSTYNTADLPQATFLYASGVPLVGVEKVDGQKCEFCFERNESVDGLLMVFASGRECLLVPSRLLAAHKHLKSLLWSQR
ncbi:hypothetical protein COU75_02705 [Candidatus Peregrinibacteria bacterium CG10_big_fil_rev_8_21_14_0_10_42_8]|nr:MAG: hypothetical protein COU75_02705 [Candidatus Peregrinibacteria bacterium CG10_big_fil_rev_8_21_14_0_10_42_8]